MVTTKKVASSLRNVVRRSGFDVVRYRGEQPPPDFDHETAETVRVVRPYTMTSDQRVGAVVDAVRHICRVGIPGDIVECGVWRGGSSLAAARTLVSMGDVGRDLHLFDTFEGMVEPTEHDVKHSGEPAAVEFGASETIGIGSSWCYASLDEVKATMALVRYPPEKIHYVKGKVEDTIPDAAPDRIALLRLDTDWYESTRHELEHLLPRVTPGGIVIIDDYGWWEGAKKAVDEFIAASELPIFLQRIDETGRMFVMPAPVEVAAPGS